MIRLHLGGVLIHINSQALADVLTAQGPRWLMTQPGEKLPPQEAAMRLAMKQAVRFMLDYIKRKMVAEGVPGEFWPDCPRGQDVLIYGAGYLLWFLAAKAEQYDYAATYRERENGDLEITGLAARTRPTSGPAGTGRTDTERLALPDAQTAGGASAGDAESFAVG